MNKQQGASLVLATIALAGLLGFAGLALDVGYEMVVRNELQNAADTSALAGAKYLYPLNGTEPNWSLANSKAAATISLNRAGNSLLSTGDIRTGYWNVTGSPLGLQSTSIVPKANDLPAIQVTITKAAGQNGGAINTFFSRIFGLYSQNMAAIGVAINGSSAGFTTSNIFPFVITQCVYDNYKLIPPTTFTIDSAYHSPVGNCQVGSWSPLTSSSPSNSLIKTLIDNASGQSNTIPQTYSIGETIYIDPGTRAVDYGLTNDCSEAGDGTCAYVPVIVVCYNSTPNCDTLPTSGGLQPTPITAFGCMHILSAKQGAKTITAQMVAMGGNGVSNCALAGSGGTGPTDGAHKPPKLVNYSGNTY